MLGNALRSLAAKQIAARGVSTVAGEIEIQKIHKNRQKSPQNKNFLENFNFLFFRSSTS